MDGLTLHEFSVAQVDRAPTWWLGGHRFESGTQIFSLSHARDMLIISFYKLKFLDWNDTSLNPHGVGLLVNKYSNKNVGVIIYLD